MYDNDTYFYSSPCSSTSMNIYVHCSTICIAATKYYYISTSGHGTLVILDFQQIISGEGRQREDDLTPMLKTR